MTLPSYRDDDEPNVTDANLRALIGDLLAVIDGADRLTPFERSELLAIAGEERDAAALDYGNV